MHPEYRLHGYARRVTAIACVACAVHCIHPFAYWKLDLYEYGPWKSCVWVFAAFLAWCGSRYSFNRAAGRQANKLDRALFHTAWISIVLAVLAVFIKFLPALEELNQRE